MNKKWFYIILGVIAAIIIGECVSLLISHYSDEKSPDKNYAGSIISDGSAITINDTEISKYTFNETPYVAVEDLLQFGICLINNSDGSITITQRDDLAIPADSSPSAITDGTKIAYTDYEVYAKGKQIQCYTADDYHIISTKTIALFGEQLDETHFIVSEEAFNNNAQSDNATAEPEKIIEGSENAKNHRGASVNEPQTTEAAVQPSGKGIVVLDPGHGKSSGEMTTAEKEEYGWVYNSSKGQWGEWRHWKTGTLWQSCEGSGCSGRVTTNGSCWYPMGNGDRDKEPQINLQNCLAAKKYLENMGYTVRLTRTSNNENPSFTKRLSYCFPNNNTSTQPDADIYVCVHSNAGGGKGSAYISLSGKYDQAGISSTYVQDSNQLGKTINDAIVNGTSLSRHGDGAIGGEPELIAFCKSPVPCGYLEIGFFDNASDLSILNNEYDSIGKAIANGVDTYLSNK